jgi:hypothetical protein
MKHVSFFPRPFHKYFIVSLVIFHEVLLVPPLFLLDSAESGGIRWSEIWQEGLLIFPFWYILSLAEFGQSGIETGMVPGLAKWNGTRMRLFVWHSLFFSSLSPPPAFITAANPRHRHHLVTLTHHQPSSPAQLRQPWPTQHHHDTVDVAHRQFIQACHVDSNIQDDGRPSTSEWGGAGRLRRQVPHLDSDVAPR